MYNLKAKKHEIKKIYDEIVIDLQSSLYFESMKGIMK